MSENHALTRVAFDRNARGVGVGCRIGGVRYDRHFYPPELGQRCSFTPTRPLAALKRTAQTGHPPHASGPVQPSDLVDVHTIDPTIHLDIRYARRDNFLGMSVYTSARAFLQRPVAQALLAAHRALRADGYGLVIFDAYRPWFVTRLFWDATPAGLKHYVAYPAQGSNHNRGVAVDVTLYDLHTGNQVEMGSAYDEFSPRAFTNYPGSTSLVRTRRQLLRTCLCAAGFTSYQREWWHFDARHPGHYPILNMPFERLATRD